MKKRHWFSLGFPILTLFIYGIGIVMGGSHYIEGNTLVTSPNFVIALLMFSMYGFIMFVWEGIEFLTGDHK